MRVELWGEVRPRTAPPGKRPPSPPEAGARTRLGRAVPAARAKWLLLPREHGAWGMVSLPFLAGAILADGVWFSGTTVAAVVAVLLTFLLRDPLVLLRRPRREPPRLEYVVQARSARRSLALCLAGLALSGGWLLLSLPKGSVLLLGAAGLTMVIGSVYIAEERMQRQVLSQMLSVVGLTASCLPAYLAVSGKLDGRVLALWAMSASHSLGAVLVVRARLERILAHRQGRPTAIFGPFYRSAVAWQGAMWLLLAMLALAGYRWVALPFLVPSALHAWELWQFRAGSGLQVSMQRVGWSQLTASILFYFLLLVVFPRQSL